MLVAFDSVAVVCALMKTDCTLNDIRRPNTRLALRQVGEENLLRLTLFAGETNIPLSGGKTAHPNLNLSSEIKGR
jgi:hypothetical protein